MKTITSLDEISDGKLYDIDNFVLADSDGCQGCNACCHDVGDLVSLTPYDVYQILLHTGLGFDALIGDKVALKKEGKLNLPYLNMNSITGNCAFLSKPRHKGEGGRCTIHTHRPDICRLFPLGRAYFDDGFKYFLQVDACVKPTLQSVKIETWLGISDYADYKWFLFEWYKLLKALTFRVKFIYDDAELTALNTYLIDTLFKITPDSERTFFQQFGDLLQDSKKQMGIL